MKSLTRSRFRAMLPAAWVAALAAGCAGEISMVGGEPAAAPPTVLAGEVRVPATTSSPLTVLEPANDAVRERLACRVPAAWGYPYLLEDPADARAISGADRVCLEERGEAEAFCRWTERFDVRQRALASCHDSVVKRLHEVGQARLGAARWARIARELPAEWQRSAAPRAPVMLATWVTMVLTGEQGDEAPATPFCLPAEPRAEPREQLQRALEALRWGWETLAADQQETLAALSGGIAVDLAGRRLELVVEVDEQPVQPPQAAGCVFRVARD